MPTQVTPAVDQPPPVPEDAQVLGVACLLLALERAAAVSVTPLARLGEDFVAATVMIDVGQGREPFDLESVRLAAQALRFDPPFFGAAALAARLSLAADQAEAQARRLVAALH